MYEFLCERIIPGCTHKETGEDQEIVLAKALEHMRDHHHDDIANDHFEGIRDKVINDAMIYLPR